MAKKSMIARDEKRKKMIQKYAEKRAELKELGDQDGLQKLPRNSSPTRWKNRDVLSGRPRGYMRRFGLNRINFREKASKGEIPGITKSSWEEGKERYMSLQSTDPIADLLTRIRNASAVGKHEVRVPSSKLKKVVADQLKKNNYLADVKVEAGKPRDTLVVTFTHPGENTTINEISRVSKPGRRVYVSADEIPKIKSGRGMVLISTSKGVITGQEAVKARLGGEVLLKVY